MRGPSPSRHQRLDTATDAAHHQDVSLGDAVKKAMIDTVGVPSDRAEAQRTYERAKAAVAPEGRIDAAMADRVARLAQEACVANRELAAVTRDAREQGRLFHEWQGLSSVLRSARSVGGYGTNGGESGVREPRRPCPGGPTGSAQAEVPRER